jgi:hypothetical protein
LLEGVVGPIEAGRCTEGARFTAVAGSIEAEPSIGAVWSVAGYITGPLADIMGSPAATIPIRHARPDIMVVASIAAVSRFDAVAFTAADPSIEAEERK